MTLTVIESIVLDPRKRCASANPHQHRRFRENRPPDRPRPSGLSSPTLQPFAAYLEGRWQRWLGSALFGSRNGVGIEHVV